jgi:hypothetical protein
LDDEALTRLAESRREFERQLADARETVRTEIGVAARRGRWLVPATAAAAGFALAFLLGRRRRHRRP